MKTVLLTLIATGIGYISGVLLGILLISAISSKQDKSVEAVMTGFFFTGPILAVLALLGSMICFLVKR